MGVEPRMADKSAGALLTCEGLIVKAHSQEKYIITLVKVNLVLTSEP